MSNHYQARNVIAMEDWFDSGSRVLYDPNQKRIVSQRNDYTIAVFERVLPFGDIPTGSRWITFAPGFPEGSFGYAKVDSLLGDDVNPRLYIEYVGQGDSDKPLGYTYSTFERADLIEAQWRAHNVQSTILVAYDFSSLVMLELLQRQRERQARGVHGTRIEHVLSISGALFADGQSRMRRKHGKLGLSIAQHSNAITRRMFRSHYSLEYRLSRKSRNELRETARAIRKHKGTIVLNKVAGFVQEHRSNAARWDLFRIFIDFCHQQGITFHIVGSNSDSFESRQLTLARERLGAYYPQVKFDVIPGGHQSVWEQAAKIAEFVTAVARKSGIDRVQRSWTTVQSATVTSRAPWASSAPAPQNVPHSSNQIASRPHWAFPSWAGDTRRTTAGSRVSPVVPPSTHEAPAHALPPSGYIISYS